MGGPFFYEMPYFGQEWVLLSDLILDVVLLIVLVRLR